MRVIGIDPGTMSFDLFGMEGDRVIIDTTLPSTEIAERPESLVSLVEQALPLDLIVGPSGYGLPLTRIEDAGERELSLMVPLDKSVPVNEGIRKAFLMMKERGLSVCFTPAVIQLDTVPRYRKANKMDMGTTDKVCCVALAMRDQAERYGIDYRDTSFILAEVGFGFNATIAVERGRIVDGLGGTSGGPGFLSVGAMDSELAMRLGGFPQIVLFSGGAKDLVGRQDLTPEELARERRRYRESWNMLLESVVKGVAAMTVSAPSPHEVLLSGRLSRVPEIARALKARLSRFGAVRRVRRRARVAKEAAEGAYIIGDGLLGGRYRGIVAALRLRKSSGTMFDHILLSGVELKKP